MNLDYWATQDPQKPLYPAIAWSKPERRDQAGKLGIIGGNKLGFHAASESYQTALQNGVGQVRILLPDCLKKELPALSNAVFASCNPSGSLSTEAYAEMRALGEWANQMLLIGDAGRNSETAVVYEKFISDYPGQLVISRDAIDLVKNAPSLLVTRPNTIVVASFAQIQKLFQGVYYPKILTFSLQLQQLVEALHKFTITYPVTLVTLHRDHLVLATEGRVITQEFSQPMRMWRGEIATTAALWLLWNPSKPLEALATSIAK